MVITDRVGGPSLYRLLLLVLCWQVGVQPALSAEPEPLAGEFPDHQVLRETPDDLMLKYFGRLAADLPPEHDVPEALEAWEERKAALRDRLWQSLGQFPVDDRPPLNVRITGRIDNGDHVVEKVLYESLPGLYVTALAYIPKQLDGPVPAVICVNGHWSESKTTALIQKRCMSLARMGVIAFCQDVIGTGERQTFDGAPPTTYHGFYRGAAPRIVDRSLLGYVVYECTRALDYLTTREDVDPSRIMCTGASGGGKQSMYFPALDERLAGGIPVCYISSYQAHIGATACVGEIPTGILEYSNQWEVLALHAPRPLLCINASRDVPVFLPRHMYDTLERTTKIYRLYGAETLAQGAEFDSGHDYNRDMRHLLYRHVAHHLLGDEGRAITEPDELPVRDAVELRVGLPETTETMQSLTYRRARELSGSVRQPDSAEAWTRQREAMLPRLEKLLGSSPDRAECRRERERTIDGGDSRIEHWVLEPEPGIVVPCALRLPPEASETNSAPAVIVVDEDGKQRAFERGVVDQLLGAGYVVLALDYRGTGETSGTVPPILYGPAAPEYNLSNYSLIVGRDLNGMRVFDVRCAIDFLLTRPEVDSTRLSLAGRGRGAFVSVLAAAFDDRIKTVVAEELLSTWVFEEEFVDIGLGMLVPGILTAADMPHVIACLCPRRVLVLNPVDGRRRRVPRQEAHDVNEFAITTYGLYDAADRLDHAVHDTDATPGAIAEWLMSSD